MNLRTVAAAVVALCAVCVAGCKDVQSDRPAVQPESTELADPPPNATEVGAAPAPEPDTEADDVADGPSPAAPQTSTDEPTDSPEDVAEDLGDVREEIADLEKDAQFFEAFKRARDLSATYGDRPEAAELIALQQRLYKDHRRSSGLDFAIRQLGSDSEVAASVAAEKLLAAGEVGLIFLRKAVRQAEPKIAAGAAEILIDQGEPQITRLMVERMEQDPPRPLGDELGKLLQRLDAIESEWIDRLCALARREGPSRPGTVGVLIDRLKRSIHAELEVTEPDDGEGEAAEEDKPEQPEPAAVEVDPRLVRTLYDVAVTAEGPLPRQAVDALLTLVLEHVNHRDGEAFDQLVGNDQAYGFVGDYVVANLESERLEDRLWAVPRAPVLRMQASGFWASVRSDDGTTVLDERVDPVLNFGDLDALRATGPVEQGQTVRWTGFVNVPADGKYTFSVDCAETSPTTLFIDSEQTTADKAVELSAGWHEMRAEMSLSGDQARIQVTWEGPDLDKQDIPVDRVVCADRTRMLIWQLGRKCDLLRARSLAAQLARSLGRVDKELAGKLMALARVDSPARPAIAAALGALLDYFIAHESEPPEWETEALPLLLSASDEISGPEQQRVVASLVNHFVRRTDSKIEEFNNQAGSPEAYGDVRAFIAERLDDRDPEVARWAMQRAGAVQLALEGLWTKTYAGQDPVDENDLLDKRLSGSLNYAEPSALQAGLAKRITWTGYLDVPVHGAYTFAVDSGGKVAIQLDGEAIEPRKAIELAAGLHPVSVEFRAAGGEPTLIVSWQPPDKTEPEVIPSNRFTCPDWPKVLTWQMAQAPQKSEAVAVRLGLMVDRIDQPLATELLALVKPDSPSALPAAEILAHVLSAGHLDDTFEKTLPEHLWPFVDKVDGQRQRVLAGALVRALEHSFDGNGAEFDKAVKAEGASQTLRDFVAERLDAEQADVAAWAVDHAGPFGLRRTGLWLERLASPDGLPVGERHHDAGLGLADLDAVTEAAPAVEGEAIRWFGYLRCPSDGPYVFTVDAANKLPATMQVAGQTIQSGKPIELPAGLHPVGVQLAIGPDAKLVVNWQRPGSTEAESIDRSDFACPDWAQLLPWQLQQEPDVEQAERICSRLARMVDQLDQSLAEQLLASIEPGSPLALPVAEVLARVLRRGHLDDEFDKTLPEHLWPFVHKAEGPRQRVLAGALVRALEHSFDGNGAEFDKAVNVEGASQTLRDFVAERLDAEERPIRLWAAEHAAPFSLLHSGLEGSYFGAEFKTRLFDRVDTKMQFEPGQFGYPDKRNDNMCIRWSGLIEIPAEGEYIFSCAADDTCRLRLDGQPVIENAKKPAAANLTAGLHEIHIEFVETTGPERLVVYWQPPGRNEPQVLQGELKHVDRVRLLVDELTDRPDDPQAANWLKELSYKADRLDAETLEELSELARERASWEVPLARVAVAAVLRDPGKAPASAARLLAKSAPGLNDDVRREAVEALAIYFSAACGSNRQKFEQAVASDKTYDFLCGEVQSVADSAEAADTDWAQEQANRLGLKISSTIHQEPGGRVVLEARSAALHGKTIQYESGEGKDNLGHWTNAEDFASWRLAVARGGTFAISLTWACEDGYEGSEFVVAVADQQLTGKVTVTGDWTDFQTMDLGTIKLDAGTHQLTVKAKGIPKKALMNLKSITLDFRE